MDLKSSFIQGMQAPIPVQQVPEDLVPYLQSLQALKQHESKYKQLDRVNKLSKKQEDKMRKEIEKSKYEYYEGEDKTSSFSPFRKALSVKLAQESSSNLTDNKPLPTLNNSEPTPKSNPYGMMFKQQLEKEIAPFMGKEMQSRINQHGFNSPEVKSFNKQISLFGSALKNRTQAYERDNNKAQEGLSNYLNQEDFRAQQDALRKQEVKDRAFKEKANAKELEENRAQEQAFSRREKLEENLYDELDRYSPKQVQEFINKGRYPKEISSLITSTVLPRLRKEEQEQIQQASGDFKAEQASRIRQEQQDSLFSDADARAIEEEVENSAQSDDFDRRERSEAIYSRFKQPNSYLGKDYNERALTRYSRKPEVPEPSYSQYFSDRFQDLKDYGNELATDANRLGTRLLRPVTSRVQGLASDAIQNFDFVRNMVGEDAARKLNEELFYATGRGEYLDRMGLKEQKPGTEEADRINKIRSAYRTGQGDYSLDSYIDKQLDRDMRAYDQDRPAPDRRDEAAFQEYNQDREKYKKDSLDNLRDFYGREGNQLGTGSIRTDNPYREALSFTQDMFSDPRKYLDQAAMGAKEKFEDFTSNIPTSSAEIYNQLDVNNPLRQFFEPEGLRDPINDVTAIEQVMRTDPEVQSSLDNLYPGTSPQEIARLIGEGLSPNANPTLKSKALEAMSLLEDQLVRQDSSNTRYFDRDEQGNYLREMTPEMRKDFQKRDELLRNSIAQINSNTQFPGGTTMLDFASSIQNLNKKLDTLDPRDPESHRAEEQILSTIEQLSPEQAEQMLQAMGIVNRTTGRVSKHKTIDLDNVKDSNSLMRYFY